MHLKKSLNLLFVIIFSSMSFQIMAADCARSMKLVSESCKGAKKPIKCFESKKSSLPLECRVNIEKTQKMVEKIDPNCVKAVNGLCKMDMKALKKDPSAYMKVYSKCIQKNQPKIEKACKGMKKLFDKKK